MPKQNPESPRTVFAKVANILDQFSLDVSALSLAELARACKIPKTTIYRLLQEMTEYGFISYDGGLYRPGTTLFRLGHVASKCWQPAELLNQVLQPVAAATGETIITAALEKDQIVYLHVIESSRPLRFVAGAGTRRELPFGATGMALLAQLKKEEQIKFLKPPFPRFTSKTIVELDPYLKRLRQVQQDALVVETGEYYEGIMAIAIPVPAKIPLTFTVVGPEKRLQPGQALITTLLRDAAESYSEFGIDPQAILV